MTLPGMALPARLRQWARPWTKSRAHATGGGSERAQVSRWTRVSIYRVRLAVERATAASQIANYPSREFKSARALDGDQVVAAGAFAGAGCIRRNRAGDVAAINIAERQRRRIIVRAAIRIGDSLAAVRPCGEAAVHAVSVVGEIGDDEHALFRMCDADAHYGSDGQRRDHGPHRIPLWRNCPRTLVAKALKNATAQ